jgi:polysaccharide export outer membrane protein
MRLLPRLSLFGCLALAACTQLPADGPEAGAITGQATASLVTDARSVQTDYVLADITPNIVDNMNDFGPGSFLKSFGMGYGPRPANRVGVGDILSISVFEASTGGLFVPTDAGARPGNFVTLPQQTVDHKGNVTVPFAGEVPAAGKSLAEIKQEIERRLARRALEPQVIVAIPEQNAASITVVGDGVGGNDMKIKPSGERILEVIARSGGLRFPMYETFVTLQRGGKSARVYFPTLVTSPQENIFVKPGDVVLVTRYQRKFMAFGALASVGQTSGLTGQFPFPSAHISLHEALAMVGGLADDRANAWEIFLYRLEKRERLEAMGIDIHQFKQGQELIPTVYRANFRDPSCFFLAQRFPMQDKDVIYVPNADSVEVLKFLTYARAITSTVAGVSSDAVTTRNAARALIGGGNGN